MMPQLKTGNLHIPQYRYPMVTWQQCSTSKQNRYLLEGLVRHDGPDHKTYDLLAELNAVVDNTETDSLADVLQDQKLTLDVVDLANWSFFSGLWFFSSQRSLIFLRQ